MTQRRRQWWVHPDRLEEKGGTEVANLEKARRPEDLTRLFVERSNAGDAAGVAELYEPGAVMAYPPGRFTVGRDAIRELWESVLAHRPHFEPEPPLPTLVCGDIALTSTPPHDGAGARAQVVRRQPDGSWLRVLDQPELVSQPVAD
jgi:ketosteroid isomerase-like protein